MACQWVNPWLFYMQRCSALKEEAIGRSTANSHERADAKESRIPGTSSDAYTRGVWITLSRVVVDWGGGGGGEPRTIHLHCTGTISESATITSVSTTCAVPPARLYGALWAASSLARGRSVHVRQSTCQLRSRVSKPDTELTRGVACIAPTRFCVAKLRPGTGEVTHDTRRIACSSALCGTFRVRTTPLTYPDRRIMRSRCHAAEPATAVPHELRGGLNEVRIKEPTIASQNTELRQAPASSHLRPRSSCQRPGYHWSAALPSGCTTVQLSFHGQA